MTMEKKEYQKPTMLAVRLRQRLLQSASGGEGVEASRSSYGKAIKEEDWE